MTTKTASTETLRSMERNLNSHLERAKICAEHVAQDFARLAVELGEGTQRSTAWSSHILAVQTELAAADALRTAIRTLKGAMEWEKNSAE